jgi:hypothetical protein
MRKLLSAIRRLARPRGSPAPDWYSAQELWEVLRREESPHMANRLSVEYAKNLQLAFNKGWDMGYSKGKQENDLPQPQPPGSQRPTKHGGS